MTPTDHLTVAGLALVDALNFSLILGTLHLLLSEDGRAARALGHLGIFYTVYLVAGILLLSGLVAVGDVLPGNTGSHVQLGVVAAMLGYGILARPARRTTAGARGRRPSSSSAWSRHSRRS